MKKLMYIAVAGIAINLAACGGGGGDDNNGSGNNIDRGGQASTKLASTPQVIDYYGDSTIEGWPTSAASPNPPVDITAPEAFETALEGSALSANHTVNNKGLSGQTSCDLLDGNAAEPFADQIQASSATTVVILNHGINDAKPDSGISVERYTECLSGLVDIAQAAGKRVILETPNPISAHSLAGYLEAMREVARSENLVLIDQYDYLTRQYGQDASVIAPDGLHPTDEIYQVKGAYAASEFLKIDR